MQLDITRDIAFVGDSFCADYERHRAELVFDLAELDQWRCQGHWRQETCWTTELAVRLGYRVAPFGFGSMSWWHSRWMFYQHYWKNPAVDRSRLDAIVFCHTNPDRINCVDNMGQCQPDPSKHDQRGMEYYWSRMHDRNFSRWARDQWFGEIAREFSKIKTVHLFCFDRGPAEVDNWSVLPGIRVVGPLSYVMIGEMTGKKKHIDSGLGLNETRCNHMNSTNNRHLAEVIGEMIENYVPGDRCLDMSRFELPNPNYQQWPHGQYWTN